MAMPALPFVTAFYAALTGLLCVVLSLLVVRQRMRTRISIGDGGDAGLNRMARVFGNFAEYAALVLVLLALLEICGGPRWLVHALGACFIVVVNTTAGVWRAPITRQRAAECLGANQLEIFVMVIIPSAVPYIVTGMRVAMASSFMSIIPAEILAADSGIGYLLQKSSLLLQTNRIFVALLTICLLGFVVDRIFRFLVERVLTRYMSYVSVT